MNYLVTNGCVLITEDEWNVIGCLYMKISYWNICLTKMRGFSESRLTKEKRAHYVIDSFYYLTV